MASRASTARSWSPPTESTTVCLHHKDEQGKRGTRLSGSQEGRIVIRKDGVQRGNLRIRKLVDRRAF